MISCSGNKQNTGAVVNVLYTRLGGFKKKRMEVSGRRDVTPEM